MKYEIMLLQLGSLEIHKVNGKRFVEAGRLHNSAKEALNKKPEWVGDVFGVKAVLHNFYKWFENCYRSSYCKIKASTDKIVLKLYIYTKTRAKNSTKLTGRTKRFPFESRVLPKHPLLTRAG